MFSNMIGLCSDYHDPDLWFSDTDDDKGKGRPRKQDAEMRLTRTLKAIEICSNCPVKQACFEQGMLPENIENGVWGGVMAGERMALSNYSINTSLKIMAIEFAKKVRLLQSLSVKE
jgi:hypothetical protein